MAGILDAISSFFMAQNCLEGLVVFRDFSFFEVQKVSGLETLCNKKCEEKKDESQDSSQKCLKNLSTQI